MDLDSEDMTWQGNHNHSSMRQDGHMLLSFEMCVAFQQHFAWLFMLDNGSTIVVDFISYLDNLPQHSPAEARFYNNLWKYESLGTL